MPATAFDHTLIGACQNIQREAEDMAGQNYAFNLHRINGGLDFVTSPDNGGIDSTIISPGDGAKLAKAQIFYDQRTRPCQTSTSLTTNICNDSTVTATRKEFIKTIGKKISSIGRYFSNDDLVIICEGSKEFIQKRLNSDLAATRERLNEVILAELYAMRGKIYHHEGAATAAGANKTLQLLYAQNSQNTPQPANYLTIEQDFKNMQLAGFPALIGNGKLDTFIRLNQMACCNSTTPYADAIRTAGAAYFYDHAAGDVFGDADAFLVIPFGIIHMLTFNKNKNIQKVFGNDGNLGTEIHSIIQDPVYPNIKWNFDMKWDCTTERWKYMYSLHWDIFNIYQSDSFATDTGTPDCTDDLISMTGVFGYKATAG
jgi:hypothetical protein